MATQLGESFSLFYIYFDWPGKESKAHSREIQRFGELIDTPLRFKAVSYQDLYSSLKKNGEVDERYMEYLGTRYFSKAPRIP